MTSIKNFLFLDGSRFYNIVFEIVNSKLSKIITIAQENSKVPCKSASSYPLENFTS